MKIGILQAGLVPPELVGKYGEYDEIFARFLAGNGFVFEGYKVVENQFPDSPEDADGWLVTGSKFGAYEDYDWIRRLEEFIRNAYAHDIPMAGVCFGHQVIAKALGGTVEKFAGGWLVGKQKYKFNGASHDVDLMAWHQDQVTVLPAGAKVFGSSPTCKYAALAYGNKAISVQPHPEFQLDFVTDLFDARKDMLSDEAQKRRNDDHSGSLDTQMVADMMARLFKRESAVY